MAVTERQPEDTFGIDPAIYHRRWAILATLCISLVMIVAAVSSLNVAIPSLQRALDASGTELQWIIDAYALVFAGVLLPAGALGDRFGRRGALQVGLVVFGAGTLVASLADDPTQLIATRVVMGVGAGFIMPATLSIIVTSFPFHERPKAIAVWAGFAGVGGALGPLLSGVLLEHFWWGSVFFINVPLVVALLALSFPILPRTREANPHPLDPIGALLAFLGLVSLVFAVIEGPEQGWGAPVTVGAFVLAVVLLLAFVRWELAHLTPTLDPRLFRVPGFGAGAGAITVAFFSLFGMFFLLTQYLQFVRGYSALEAGVRTIPNALAMVLVSPQAPKLVQRFGVRSTMRAGFVLTAVGFALLATASPTSPILAIEVALVCTGSGMAFIAPAASQHVVGSLPLSKAGVGSAVNDVTREVGGALGIAVLGSIVATVYRDAGLPGESIGATIGAVRGGAVPAADVPSVLAAAGDAFTDGTRAAFATMTVVALLGGLLLTRVIPNALPTRQPGGDRR